MQSCLQGFEKVEKEQRDAQFSPCRLYRYALLIAWDTTLKPCQFIGLNPSTADEFQDDPTVRRCKSFARREGFGGIIMTNLFAFRATDPRRMLKTIHDPVGEINSAGEKLNDSILHMSAKACGLTIACWGNHGAFRNRAEEVRRLIPDMKCFGFSMAGQPLHPLYLSANTALVPFP